MKHVAGIIAAALLVAGCVQQMENPEENKSPVFTASLENAVTKTCLDGDHKSLWTADDRLSIFINTYNQQYRYTGESGKTSAGFEVMNVSGFHSGSTFSTNYAVYPYKPDTEITNDGTITCTLPAVQAYAENSFGLGANTMVAVTSAPDDYFLPFRNLCGYLVVKFYGEGTVKSISLKGNNGEKISGAATVTASYGNEPKVSMPNAATKEITLDCGSGVVLGSSSETATEFWFCIPPVTFSQGFTLTVTDMDGKVFEKGVSSSKTISRNIIDTLSAIKASFASPPSVPEMVDLDLPSGLKWASFNLGASKPEEYGGYYQWGGLLDVTDASIYLDWSYCPYLTGSNSSTGWTKYIPSNMSSYWSGVGRPDNKKVLDPEDDVAHVKLGGKWRMPTNVEFQELIDNCALEWTVLNGVRGGRFISKKNGNSIFLPAAGFRYGGSLMYAGSNGYYDDSCGRYWSSSLDTDYPYNACYMYFGSNIKFLDYYIRYVGCPVRPVFDEGAIHVPGISLNKSCVTLVVGSSKTLIATISSSNAANENVTWSSDNTEIATVDANGLVTAVKAGTATITAMIQSGGHTATCVVTVIERPADPEMVDLGLPSGLKWASCNLGASEPEEYGGYYQWAGLDDVTDVSIFLGCSNCPYHTGSSDYSGWTKYVPLKKSSYWSGAGSPDDKTVLDPEDDVAYVTLGGKWRMPTKTEFQELIDNCTSEFTTMNGVNGRKFTSNKNGNSIFLPAAGYRGTESRISAGYYGYYWSSSLHTDNPYNAFSMSFYSLSVRTNYYYRSRGHSVRPVSE